MFSQLAVAAALAYLLILPVQTFALFRQTSLVNQGRVTRIRGAEQRLTALRSVVETSSSNEQLNRRLQELNGPVLGPADRVQPLPLLKAQVNAVLDQAAIQILRERESSPVVGRIALLPDLLRNALSNGALAFGFAALGRLPGAKQSPLRQLQSAWQWRHRSRSARRKRPLDSLLRLIDRNRLRFRR